jgi:hypothetical protein
MSYTYIGNQSSSFLKAVSANANASFIQANSAYIHTNASYTSQNTTGIYANSAYAAANTADQRAVTSGDYANSAYLLANTKLAAAGGIISGDLEVTGNLSVKGEFTSIETETVRIFDNLIDLNSNFTIGTPNENAGIRIIRGDEVAVQFRWNESQAYWQFTNDGINFLKIGSLSGEVYANAAYTAANVADQRAVTSGDYANSSYFKANTNGNYANSAYLAANVADQKAVSAGVYANTAYTHANVSYVSQNTTGIYANTAYEHANASYVSQNTTGVYANSAYAHANTKFPTAGGTISGDVVISGNLTIVGNTVYANTETVVIKDNIVTLNAAIDQSSAPSVDAGIEIDRGSSANVSLIWNETSDKWTFTNDGTIYSPIGSAASESYANSAYTHSNSSYNAANVADQKAVSSGSYANSSYLHANASYVSQNTTGVYANTAYTHANASYVSQNTTGVYANTAYIHANSAYVSQNTTGVYANTAYLHANSAYELANVLSTGGSFSVSMVVDNFVGDGTTNQFFLSKTPANEDYITVTIEGITQLKSSYMLAGNELIFSEPPVSSDRIDVTIFSSAQLDLNTFASNIANVSAVYANAAYNHANAAFETANNVAGVTDSFARDTANSASSYANGAYGAANSSSVYANAAFNAANNATDTWVRTAANSASSYANGAYGAANTADQKAVSAGVYVNAAYGQANTATTNSATADQKAVSAGVYANAAYGQANTTNTLAQSAFDAANNAVDTWVRDAANSASSYANASYGAANTADQKAVSAGVYANGAYGQANTKLSSSGGTISGDLQISGNLIVVGNTVTHSANDFIVDDPIILIANNNIGNLLDVGFVAHYIESSTTKHTGLIRDVSGDIWYLFDNYEPHVQETNILNVSDSSFRVANLTANLITDSVKIRNYDPIDYVNSSFSAANSASSYANVSYNSANSAGSYANSAFNFANTLAGGTATDGWARTAVNSASLYANSGFNIANTADQKAVSAGSYANSAYNLANTTNTLAQAAFNAANNATDTWVRTAANSASSYANGAFSAANNSLNVQSGGSITGDISITGNLTVTGCSSSFLVSSLGTTDNIIDLGVNTVGTPTQNSGIRVIRGDENTVQFRWNETNDHWSYTENGVNFIRIGSYSDGIYANAAFQSSNSSSSYANGAYSLANTVNTLAQAAFNAANNATDTWVRTAANSASSYANGAFSAANSASNYANGSFAVVNVVNQKAASSYTHSNSAYDTANSSSVYANAAFNVANNAVDTWVRTAANSASSYANSAYGAANTADQKAVSAGVYANSAYNKANITFDHASAAFDTANAIIGGGNFTLSVVLDNFVADGSNNIFTLSTSPLNENYTLITIEGVTQLRSDYVVSGNTVTFSEAPENGARIDVTIFSSEVSNLQDAYNKANSAFNVANNSLNVSTGGTITGNIVVGGNVVPTTDNVHFLGSDTNRWHSLYVGPGSINIDGIVLSNVNGILTISGTDTIQIPNLPDLSLISDRANTANNLAQEAFNAANTKSQFTISSLPPSGANHGDRWFDSDIGQEFVYINDGDSQQWVELSAFVDQNYVEGISYYRLENDYTGSNSTDNQSFFGVGSNLIANTVYEFESIIFLNKNSGSNTHNLSISFGGTSMLNNILYSLDYTNTNVNVIGNSKNILINTTSETTITETVDTNNHTLKIKGSLSVNSSGSFVPNYKLSEVPGSSFLTKKGSYFKLKIIGGSEGNNISIGSWF